MKKFFSVLVLTLVCMHVHAESLQTSSDLTITVAQIEHHRGEILMALHSHKGTYLSKDPDSVPYRSQTARVTDDSQLLLVVGDLPVGKYAVSIFHDVNSNGELDTGFLGIPKEPYGFSNNVNSMTPPSFEDALFTFSSESNEVEIRLK